MLLLQLRKIPDGAIIGLEDSVKTVVFQSGDKACNRISSCRVLHICHATKSCRWLDPIQAGVLPGGLAVAHAQQELCRGRWRID